MNKKALGSFIVTAFLACGCASSTTTAGDGAEAAKTAEPEQAAGRQDRDPNELICKRVKKTGSNLRTKVCATRAEWEESEENMPELLDSKDLY